VRAQLIALFFAAACARPAPVTTPSAEPNGDRVPSPSATAPVEVPGEPGLREPIDAGPPDPSAQANDVATRPLPVRPAGPVQSDDDGPSPPYERGAWPHWIDADGDCQDTRTEVLIAESIGPVTFTDDRECEIASGRWRCPYTDRTFSDPRQLDVDHFVPLAEAYRSGGDRWTKQQRTDYANDLGDPEQLVAVYRSANRSKGSKNIVAWLPEEPGSRCDYVETWLRIKQRWHLRVDAAERAAADAYLQTCAAKGVPEIAAASTTQRGRDGREVVAPTDGSLSCCRTCKSGQPCGDACISASKTCRKPPGCACAAPP
jgi:hypothetical protein